MLNNSQTYTNLGSAQISIAGVPAVVKSSEGISEGFKGKRFIAAALIAVSLSVSTLQAGFVLNANATGNPLTSPLSTQESPTPSPSASAPVTSPEVSPSPSPSDTPITAPEVSPTPTPKPSDNNSNPGPSNPGPSNNGGGSAPSCNNEAPKAPYIVSAITTGKNEITLNWTKPAGNVTHYSVAYGLTKNKPLYGVANVGNVTSFKVKGLSGGVTYFFTVKAVNDCTPSIASNEIAIKVGGKFINSPAVGFKNAVLGKTSNKVVQFKPNNDVVVKVNEGSKPVNIKFEAGNTLNPGLIGKAVTFFKGLFN
jgi:hypothetical protein